MNYTNIIKGQTMSFFSIVCYVFRVGRVWKNSRVDCSTFELYSVNFKKPILQINAFFLFIVGIFFFLFTNCFTTKLKVGTYIICIPRLNVGIKLVWIITEKAYNMMMRCKRLFRWDEFKINNFGTVSSDIMYI